MLLVHDDEADVAQRGEDGRAGTNHHTGIATARLLPVAPPLGQAEAGVEDSQGCPEPSAQVRHQCRGETDFRHQNQHLATRLQGCSRRPQIDLRLAGSGDSVQHECAGLSRMHRRLQFVERGLLVIRQAGQSAGPALCQSHGRCRRSHLRHGVQPGFPPEGPASGCRDPFRHQFRLAAAPAAGDQQGDRPGLSRRPPQFLKVGRPVRG